MKVFVDQEMCIGCGLCEMTAPDVFRMNDDGKAEAYGECTEDNIDAVKEAVDACPVGAIAEEG